MIAQVLQPSCRFAQFSFSCDYHIHTFSYLCSRNKNEKAWKDIITTMNAAQAMSMRTTTSTIMSIIMREATTMSTIMNIITREACAVR